MFKYIFSDEKKWAVFEGDNATLIKSKNIDTARNEAKYLEKIISISVLEELSNFLNTIFCQISS